MSRKLLQFRLATLLLLVTVSAVGLSFWRGYRHYSAIAAKHEHEARLYALMAEWTEIGGPGSLEPEPATAEPAVGRAAEQKNRAEPYRIIAAYHQQLRDKYRRAAWSPFLSVAPDPPAPPEPTAAE